MEQLGMGGCVASGVVGRCRALPELLRVVFVAVQAAAQGQATASPPAVADSGDEVKVLPAFPGIQCCWCWDRVDETPSRAHISHLNIS